MFLVLIQKMYSKCKICFIYVIYHHLMWLILTLKKLTIFNNMFSSCGRLTSLDLGNFKTGEVVDFSCLFKGNKFLKKINISNFNTTRMNSYNDIFSNLPEIGTITINIKKTSALLLNQIPKAWKIVKIDGIKFFLS